MPNGLLPAEGREPRKGKGRDCPCWTVRKLRPMALALKVGLDPEYKLRTLRRILPRDETTTLFVAVICSCFGLCLSQTFWPFPFFLFFLYFPSKHRQALGEGDLRKKFKTGDICMDQTKSKEMGRHGWDDRGRARGRNGHGGRRLSNRSSSKRAVPLA